MEIHIHLTDTHPNPHTLQSSSQCHLQTRLSLRKPKSIRLHFWTNLEPLTCPFAPQTATAAGYQVLPLGLPRAAITAGVQASSQSTERGCCAPATPAFDPHLHSTAESPSQTATHLWRIRKLMHDQCVPTVWASISAFPSSAGPLIYITLSIF